jgi:crotonobetainyl-CoA:carnitine CoA-transferase CaiB-like acyl-CoA transferase
MLHRERSGEALHVEVPLMEAALASLVNVASGTLMTGEAPKRLGNAHPHIVPYQTFACLDGDFALGCGSDRQFEVLALWAGIDLDREPLWRMNRGRVEDRARLVPVLEAHFARTSQAEALAFCDAHAIPASPVRTVDEVLFREAGNLHQLVTTMFDPEDGRMIPMLASPVLFNDLRARSRIPPPRLRE